MSQPLNIICASRSETGRRAENDDRILVDPHRGVFLICDGARGKYGGHTAGQLATQLFAQQIDRLPRNDGPGAEQQIDTVVMSAHQQILQAIAADSQLEGMTTTLAMVLKCGNELILSHVGDSRIYRLRAGLLEQLTRDHNVENYLQDNPQLRDRVNVPGKTLVRALGLKSSTQLQVDHDRLSLLKDDLILICTDGLTDSVPEMTLGRILTCSDLEDLQQVAGRLIRAALSHGSMDNISVVVLQATDRQQDMATRTVIYDVDSIAPDKADRGVILGWFAFVDPPKRGQVIPLEASTAIGADPGCRIVISDPCASSRHAEVFRTEYGFMIRDLRSTNGTFINNKRVDEASLVDGDIIRVGNEEMVFKIHRW
jgi:serine/threonine protein phosphatase PrpC